jgi:hypothetical protein
MGADVACGSSSCNVFSERRVLCAEIFVPPHIMVSDSDVEDWFNFCLFLAEPAAKAVEDSRVWRSSRPGTSVRGRCVALRGL